MLAVQHGVTAPEHACRVLLRRRGQAALQETATDRGSEHAPTPRPVPLAGDLDKGTGPPPLGDAAGGVGGFSGGTPSPSAGTPSPAARLFTPSTRPPDAPGFLAGGLNLSLPTDRAGDSWASEEVDVPNALSLLQLQAVRPLA